MMITLPPDAPLWAHRMVQDIGDELARLQARRAPVALPTFAKANMPNPALYPAHWIYVSDDVGGATPAFSDGTNFRRVSDRAIIA